MARATFLPFSPPCLSELEINAVIEVLRKDWLTSGPKTKEFEENFCKVVGAESALALNSCTAGLHLSMILHGVEVGREVITSPLTFCATANVVEHEGGTVVLADVDPETLLIDVAEIEKRMTRKTQVIVPVHYAGTPCDMPAINALAAAHKVAVVEDAAHCMPGKTTVAGQMVGASSNLTNFSFYATKNITTGEGGMMTGPMAMIDEARSMALHGMTRNAWGRFTKGASWKYDMLEPGYKYNLTDMASALGVVQLARVDELFEQRMKIIGIYEEAFAKNEYFVPLKQSAGVESSRHLYVIQLNLAKLRIGRDEFITHLTERNIGTSVHYTPVHQLTYYAKKYSWTPESFPNAYQAGQRMLSLPLSSRMSREDACDVVAAVNDVCLKFKR